MPLYNPGATVNAGATPQLVRHLWGPCTEGMHGASTASVQTTILNTSAPGNSVAAYIMSPKAGVLDRIGVNMTAHGGTPPAYNVGFVTVDASYNPTTTPAGASATATWTPGVVNGWQWITLPTGLTVTEGQIICPRVWPGAVAPDGTNNITLASFCNSSVAMVLPAAITYNGTVWTRQSAFPSMGARFRASDGSDSIPMSCGTATAASAVFSNATSPDCIGAKFQVPMPMLCFGAQIHIVSKAVTSTADVRLYDAANTLLGTVSIPAQLIATTTGVMVANVHWPAVQLAGDTDYRLVVVSTNADNHQVVEFQVSDISNMPAHAEGSRWMRTERTAAGAWTDTPTTLPCTGIWVSAITG